MSPSRSRRSSVVRFRGMSGFTLMEVLLATTLVSGLLFGIWSLLGIYTNLFSAGEAKTEQAQLARALIRQFSDDLASAIQDPIGGVASPGKRSTPVRRFGLLGTSRSLRIDILQVTPLAGNPTAVSDSDGISREPAAPRVPELRTVSYTFEASFGVDEPGPRRLPGLVRREADFETPTTSAGQFGPARPAESGGSAESDMLGPASDSGVTSAETFTPDPVDLSLSWVPEVADLEFRYFDGRRWTGQWDSLQRRSLPVAVEVVLRMKSDEEKDAKRGSGGAISEGAPDLSEAAGLVLGSSPQGPTYRVVVGLPGSPSLRGLRGTRPIRRPAARGLSSRAPRRIGPPRRSLSTGSARPSDEWMRIEP